MSATMEDLERRLKALEEEVAALRQTVRWQTPVPAPRGDRLPHESDASPEEMRALWEKVRKKMGITCEPISAERLQQMMIEQGKDPNDNSFSRDLIAMREGRLSMRSDAIQ